MPDHSAPAATPEPGQPAGAPVSPAPDEVEEVLSAIRRLITQGAPAPARPGPIPPPAPLVLTAELRVVVDPLPPDRPPEPLPEPPLDRPVESLANPPSEPRAAEPLVLGPPLAPPEPVPARSEPARNHAGPEEPEAPRDPSPAAKAAAPTDALLIATFESAVEGFVFGADPSAPAAAPLLAAEPEPAPTVPEEADPAPVAPLILHLAPSDPPVAESAPAADHDPEPDEREAASEGTTPPAPAAEGFPPVEVPLPPLVLSPASLASERLPTPRPPWEDPAAAAPDWPELRRMDAPEADASDAGLAAAVLSAAQASLPNPAGPPALEPAAPGLPDDLRALIAQTVREEVQKGLASLHEALRAELAPKPKAARAARKKG